MKFRAVFLVVVISIFLLLMFFTPLGKSPAKAVVDFDPDYIQLVEVNSGLTQPLAITHAGDGSGRLFVAERAGRIRVVKNGVLLSTPFLDIDSIVNSSSGEQGLLALAFHPNYSSNGRFYTAHTIQDGSVVLSRFVRSQSNPDLADPNSRVTLLTIPHPVHTNHNGGTLVFGPDGYLYWSMGDGGGAGDTANNAQNLTVLLGKILRLNVDAGSPYSIPTDNPFFNSSNPSIRKEIWAYGLRNPWKISFDRQTNDLFIGDVGQGLREEIDFQPASSNGGENYGWRVMEGTLCFNASSCDQSGKVLPVAEYDHTLGCSVTGGHVYRGPDFPSLQGYYFYGDFCSGRLFRLHQDPQAGWESIQLMDTPYNISTFGEDEQGELYLADYGGGKIYQIRYLSFADVPVTHPYYEDIEILYANGLTGGCNTSPLMFCPDDIMNRAQSAVFMVRGMLGADYIPPATPRHIFADDWTPGTWAEPWAEAMYDEKLTTGCFTSPLLYCPWQQLPREQLVIFGLRMKYGIHYQPPQATGTLFADMTDPNYYATPWAEQAYRDGLLPACGTSGGKPLFCPRELVSRGLGAYVIVRAKNLSMP